MEIELHVTSFLLFLFTSICILSFFKPWRSKPPPKPHHRLPPSPPSLPVIGHLHHLVGRLPHHALTFLSQKYGPVLYVRFCQMSAVVISSPSAAKEVLVSQDPACADRPDSIGIAIMWHGHAGFAFAPYGDHWRHMRRICVVELLSAISVKSFAQIRHREISRLVNSLRAKSRGRAAVDLTAEVTATTCATTFRAAFGRLTGDRQEMIRIMKEAVTMASGFEVADLFPSSKLMKVLCWNRYKLLWMRRRVDRILDSVVEEHRSNQSGEFGGVDIVDVLLRMQKNNELPIPITNHNIKAIIFDIFSSGTETTLLTIDWAMAELVRNPRVMQKAQTEIRDALKGKKKTSIEESDIEGLKYLKLVIKETLRLHPPVPFLPRLCRAECEVKGYTIPLKSKVMINVWAMGRDPQYWDRPEEFWPERFEESCMDFLGSNLEYIPFGAGRRACPGISFGSATAEIMLTQLLYHFDWEGVADMTEVEGFSAGRKHALLVLPTPYHHS